MHDMHDDGRCGCRVLHAARQHNTCTKPSSTTALIFVCVFYLCTFCGVECVGFFGQQHDIHHHHNGVAMDGDVHQQHRGGVHSGGGDLGTKLGSVAIGIVEQTPFVFNGRPYRMDSIRSDTPGNPYSQAYLRILDLISGRQVGGPIGLGSNPWFGCAFVRRGVVYLYATRRNSYAPGSNPTIMVFSSQDLQFWEQGIALNLPEDFDAYNTSVDEDEDGHIVMAVELGAPANVVGVRFTMVFATSGDGFHYQLLDPFRFRFSPEKYTACPALRRRHGYWYMLYLDNTTTPNAPTVWYETYVVRSRDLGRWQEGRRNPFLVPSDAMDKIVCESCAYLDLNDTQIAGLAAINDWNNSDPDLMEYNNVTTLFYMWGDQLSTETAVLAVWEYNGPMSEMFASMFEDVPEIE